MMDWINFTSHHPDIQVLNIAAKFGTEFTTDLIAMIVARLPDLQYITLKNLEIGGEFDEDFVNKITRNCKQLKAIEFNYFETKKLDGITKSFEHLNRNFVKRTLQFLHPMHTNIVKSLVVDLVT